MAYINVAEWSPDQVTDWLKGLDNSMYHYIQSFTNNQVDGQQLLNIRPYELEQLGMHSIGHQEIVLEAVEYLRNFHYHLDKENLQFLALHVATAASCLYKELKNHCDKSEIETHILNDIARTLFFLKPLVAWLDRSPFQGHSQFNETRDNILKFGLEMATVAQRERFVENPVEQIRGTAQKLAKLANYIIQDITDPMVLQPASLDLVTLKKRESDLGFYIMPSYHGVLRISDIKFNSPAHNSNKIEEGDEIVQINYQTVVGWQYKKVIMQLQESPTDVLLTLKKRPKHTKIYGQIYMKPYRLPSKKRALPYKWGENLPSPRPELLSVPNYPMPLSRVPEKQSSNESINSDILTPTTDDNTNKDLRLYLPKPRAVLQRRNTICGDRLTSFKHLGNVMFWQEKRYEMKDEDSPSLRDKSISFGFGLELSQRPTTCLGITNGSNGTSKRVEFTNAMKGSLPEMIPEKLNESAETTGTESNCFEEKLKTGVSKVVRFDSNKKFEIYHIDTKYTCNVDNTVLETFEPIPYVDEEVSNMIEIEKPPLPDIIPITQKVIKMSKDTGVIEAINTVVINREIFKRGKLDKSHSTPIYDDDPATDIPPAIEPRKEFLNKTPPVPPPRPRRMQDNKSPIAKQIDLNHYNNKSLDTEISILDEHVDQNINERPPSSISNSDSLTRYTTQLKHLPPTKHFLEERFEALELLTPNKTKSLTLKKKNSMLAKRRKISLKTLGTSDIQGHLYRRSKNKHGVTYWAKLYFVLIDAALYGFKSKTSTKADCLIFLTGFTVSLANEVHSKSFAFKVYHPSKSFYFAAETKEALSQWMEYIRQATLKGNTNSLKESIDQNIKELFTETESSDDEFGRGNDNRILSISDFYNPSSSSRNTSSKPQSDHNASNVSSKSEKLSYHLNFGSLKKFTKSNLPSFSSLNKQNTASDKKLSSNDVPVPTAQFRTYRKVPGNAGIQLGTNSMTQQAVEINVPCSSHHHILDSVPSSPLAEECIPLIKNNSSTPNNNVLVISTQQPITYLHTEKPQKSNIIIAQNNIRIDDNSEFEQDVDFSFFSKNNSSSFSYKINRKNRIPYTHNYIHASNPNLVEFDFQTSKSLDHSLPKINSTNTWDAHPNLQGFVTLKDLMLQKQAEEAQEMYNHRVYLGVEKKDDHRVQRIKSRSERESNYDDSNEEHSSRNKPVLNKIQSRSLPKTPDYAQSFKPDDKEIIMARSKEGQKLRDFGYEFISGDDSNQNQQHMNKLHHNVDLWVKRNDKISPSSNTLKKKGITWISSDLSKKYQESDEKTTSRQGSLKKAKNKLDNLKASSEKLFQFKHYEKESLKLTKSLDKPILFNKPSNSISSSSFQSTNLTLNTSKKSSGSLLNSIYTADSNTGHSSKNDTMDLGSTRKLSTSEKSTSYLSKLNFTATKTAKERKLLGSPRLHRAIFGRSSSSNCDNQTAVDHEIFSPINFTKQSDTNEQSFNSAATADQHIVKPTPSLGSPDYPNMEYPPVFEAETYSLSDPNTSLTLLRRRNTNNQTK